MFSCRFFIFVLSRCCGSSLPSFPPSSLDWHVLPPNEASRERNSVHSRKVSTHRHGWCQCEHAADSGSRRCLSELPGLTISVRTKERRAGWTEKCTVASTHPAHRSIRLDITQLSTTTLINQQCRTISYIVCLFFECYSTRHMCLHHLFSG